MTKFKSYRVADVSTTHLTAEDGKRILDPKAPCSLAFLHGQSGTFFFVPNDERDLIRQFAAAGFSAAFVNIMVEVKRRGFPYVRFDACGQDYPNLPTFSW